jgi:hypothetical protein
MSEEKTEYLETEAPSTIPPTEDSKLPEVRDPKTGKFVKGNKAHDKYVIERKKEKAAPILAAITEEFTPEEIRLLLRRGVKAAQTFDDGGKQLLDYIRFIAAYAIGKPIGRAINVSATKEDFLDFFRRSTNEENDEDTNHDRDTIDAEYDHHSNEERE